MARQSFFCKWQFFIVLAGITLLTVFVLPDIRTNLKVAKEIFINDQVVDVTPANSNALKNKKIRFKRSGTGNDTESDDVIMIKASGNSVKEMVLDAVSEMMKNITKPPFPIQPITDVTDPESTSLYPGASPDDAEVVALCMIIKNQLSDLKEFVTHHYHHLGIRRFYIMDDGSNPPLSSFDDYGIAASAITFTYFNASERVGGGKMQHHAYNACNERWGHLHKWIGYFDADEIIEIVSEPGRSMAQFLEPFEKYGALGIQWQTHNSNGLLNKSTIGNRKAYTSCIWDGEGSDNRHIKSIVQTKYYVGAITPHNFRLNSSAYTVGENFDRVEGPFRHPITRYKIALHHFGLKSKEDYREKMLRGSPTGNGKNWEWWISVEKQPKVDCSSLAKYHP